MADAKDYAFKGLDIVGGLGGAIAGIFGGSEGAKGAQLGVGAIKDIVGMATEGGQTAAPTAPQMTQAAPMPAPQPTPAAAPPQREPPSRVRRFDAPMFQRVSGRRSDMQAGDAIQEPLSGAQTPAGNEAPEPVTSEQARTYVTSFAARLVLSLAYALSELGPPDRWDEELRDWWVLALVWVGWYADRLPGRAAAAVAIALQPIPDLARAAPTGLFGRRLLPFVQATHDARSETGLEAAGALLATMIQRVGVERFFDSLRTARSAPLTDEIRQQVSARLPYPADLASHFYEVLERGHRQGSGPMHPAAEAAGYAPHTEDYDHDSVMAAGIGDITEKLS